jgi:hypothetical protein
MVEPPGLGGGEVEALGPGGGEVEAPGPSGGEVKADRIRSAALISWWSCCDGGGVTRRG